MPLAHINNRDPRYDLYGTIVDAHDGGLEYFAGRFYWYGTAYGTTDGFTPANTLRVYSSPDLTSWTPHGDILPQRPPGVYYRPYVKYCAATQMYVLWFNWYPTLWDGQLGVAISAQPEGPFHVVNPHVQVQYGRPGDLGLLVDEDGTGYLIYTSIAEDHGISIERLAADYCSSTLHSSGIIARGDEACALVKHAGRYYALFDTCCCFCPHGSGAKVFTAAAPLGPYTFRNNINRRAAPGSDVPIVRAQQAHLARFATTNGAIVIWTGDRWGSRPDSVKGHDFQFWSAPLHFGTDGTIAPLQWVDAWSCALPDP